MPDVDPTGRFTAHADTYALYRPGYPPTLFDVLRLRADFSTGQTIADIGCGTGISTMLLAHAGYRAIGVEPNDAMRSHAARSLGNNARLVNGTAEHTTLPDASVDHVMAFQAFHWFDRIAFKKECERILKPGGYIVLVWNDRVDTGDDFAVGYEQFLREACVNYKTVSMKWTTAAELERFFEPSPMDQAVIASEQLMDWDGLRGRFLSSSYAPLPGSDGHEPAMAALKSLFDHTQSAGRVTMRYETKLYFGPVRPNPAAIFDR